MDSENLPRKVRATGIRVLSDEEREAQVSNPTTSSHPASANDGNGPPAAPATLTASTVAAAPAPAVAAAAPVVVNMEDAKASESWSAQELSIFRNSIEVGMVVGLGKLPDGAGGGGYRGDSWAQVGSSRSEE